jgi:hypothetical protein
MGPSRLARRGELIALTVERVKFDSAGGGTALIYMSKVDREELRYWSHEVITHLRRGWRTRTSPRERQSWVRMA